MLSKHVGMALALKNIIHSIKCDESQKYERFFCIAYLPKRGNLDDCILAGCLEISKDSESEDKQFYNPSKFYSPETLYEAVIHLLATYMAFKALRSNMDLSSAVNRTINSLYLDKNLRNKIRNLAEGYYRRIRALSLEAQSP